jgi:hypothetical protein
MVSMPILHFSPAQSSTADDPDITYHLMLRKQDVLQLCVRWQSKVRGIPCDVPLDELWGPADDEVQGAVVAEELNGCVAGQSGRGESEDDDDSDVGDTGQDGDLFEEAEFVAFNDVHRAYSYSPDLDNLL